MAAPGMQTEYPDHIDAAVLKIAGVVVLGGDVDSRHHRGQRGAADVPGRVRLLGNEIPTRMSRGP